MKRFSLGAVGLLLLGLLMACNQLTPPGAGPEVTAVPGDNGKIAFTRNLDGNVDIYLMNADGSDQTRLTSHPEYDNSPAWSPDGSRIAFSRFLDIYPYNGDIYLMNADGSNQINLTSDRTTEPTRPTGRIDSDPAWSPDASQLAFTYTYDAPFGDLDIYLMNADGSDRTILTSGSWFNVSAAWSPDGSKIAFASVQDRNREIFVMNTDGSDPINLTDHPARDGAPTWSPDGSQIAFESDRNGNTEIYLMNADGSNQTRLTNHPADDGAPTWSPDGSQIAFQSDRDGNTEIYLMNADGSNQINLTNHPAYDRSPDWQPNLAPPSPAEAIAALMEQIEDLDLIRNTERSLLSLLEQAQRSAERGNTRATLGKLGAFINQVEAQRGKKIPEVAAESLITAAERIIGLLGTPEVHVIINEFLADPPPGAEGDSNEDGVKQFFEDEFVEIANLSGAPVDLSGWTLSDLHVGVRHVFPASTVVPDQCAIVVFGGGAPALGSFGGAIVQTASTGQLALSNGGDQITLNDGVTDQAVQAYGPEGASAQSFTRDPDLTGSTFVRHGIATGSGGALLSPGTMIDGTPFAGCPPVQETPLIINEVLPDPPGDSNQDGVQQFFEDEFVEVVNVSGAPIDLSGWLLRDNTDLRHVFPPGTIVANGCAIVIFGGGTPAAGAFGGALVQTASTGSIVLGDGGDIVKLVDPVAGRTAAVMSYVDARIGQSLTRDPDVTGSSFVRHGIATGSGGALLSPGTMIDGTPFPGCALNAP